MRLNMIFKYNLKNNIKNIILLCLLLSFSIIFLMGCAGKGETEKSAYNDELTKYYNLIYSTSVSINNINVEDEGSAHTFLGYMDIMSQNFTELSQIDTPERYEPLQELCTQAALDMETAVNLYHEIYASPDFSSYDQEKAADAYLNYTNAMKVLNQLGNSIMADEIANGYTVSEN